MEMAMHIRVRARDIDNMPDLALEADRQVRNAMGRLSRRISGVAVRLFDVNGPRGGVDKACEVTVSLGRAGIVHYRAVECTTAAAVGLAVSGVRAAVRRRVALRRETRRRPGRRRSPGLVAG